MKRADSARVTTFVAVAPHDAFEVFTEETDLWWRRGPRYRFSPEQNGMIRFDGGEGGRLVETFADGTEFVCGKVLVWEPGRRLVFEWRARAFGPDERTEVEVLFEAMNDGTQVTLEHRGWASLPDDHPVRRGLGSGQAFADMIGLWWGELATSYRAHVSGARKGR
ncbi:MAG: SRPBCC domain-containing protein [Planctomycetota bacterium]